jgi:glyoxylate/hydroxypyruvate reductase A
MGIGVIGSECARKLAALGFRVLGWSRTRKELPGVECLHGLDRLPAFLHETEILLVVLPATQETAGILDAARLRMLRPGACLINIARGSLIVESDLLAALDAGHLEGAFLDVTQNEPLPASSPLWTHPKVRLTPHIAGLTNPATAIEPIVDNIRRLKSGRPLRDLVERARGY